MDNEYEDFMDFLNGISKWVMLLMFIGMCLFVFVGIPWTCRLIVWIGGLR